MAEEFVLVPKQFYIQKEPLAAKILDDAQIQSKANFLSLLQRERQPQTPPKEPETLKTNKDLDKSAKYLEDLTILGPTSREKGRLLLQRLENLDNVEFTDQDTIAIDGRDTNVSVSNFLYLSQQPNKKYQEQEYQKIFDEVQKSKHLITNNQAQRNYRKETTTTSKKRKSTDDDPFHDVEQEVKKEWHTFSSREASPGKTVSTRSGGFRK